MATTQTKHILRIQDTKTNLESGTAPVILKPTQMAIQQNGTDYRLSFRNLAGTYFEVANLSDSLWKLEDTTFIEPISTTYDVRFNIKDGVHGGIYNSNILTIVGIDTDNNDKRVEILDNTFCGHSKRLDGGNLTEYFNTWHITSPALGVTGATASISKVQMGSYSNTFGYMQYDTMTSALGFGTSYHTNALSIETQRIYLDGTHFQIHLDTKKIAINHSAPDCSAYGLTINQGAAQAISPILTFKNSFVNHGVTQVAQTDTYALFNVLAGSDYVGGLAITGVTLDKVALAFCGTIGTEDSSSNGWGVCTINLTKTTGPGVSGIGGTTNMFVIQNLGTNVFRVLGNGDVRIPTGRTYGTFDNEDDLMLVDAAKKSMAGWDGQVMDTYKDKLEELGIIEDSFMSLPKMHALELGAIGQIMNILKVIGNKLGYTENELLSMAKQY